MSRVVSAPGAAVPGVDRFRITQWLRIGAVGLVLLWRGFLPDTLAPDQGGWLLPWTGLFVAVAVLAEVAVRLAPPRQAVVLRAMLAADGVWLAYGAYLTGATTSPLRYLLLLQLGAVSMLVSPRAGVRLALWNSLLLVTLSLAVAQGALAQTAHRGRGSATQGLLVFLSVLWLAAVFTSWLSARNERERRRRRFDLEALTSLAEQIERTDDSASVARSLLLAVVSGFGFRRGVVLGSPDGQLPLLASSGLDEEVQHRPGRPGGSAVVAQAQEQQGTVLVRGLDLTGDAWLARLLPGATNLVVVPLAVDGRGLGALVLEHPGGGRIQRRLVAGLERSAALAALALRNAWVLEQLERLASTDGLTKIANRRTFESTLERELARATRNAEHVSLVLIDIDHFKRLNDTQGHQAGDEVLRNVAAALTCVCREFDTPARYGGEEFAVILPGCGPDEALDIAERLRRSVSDAPSAVPVTASAGVATYPSQAGDGETLIRAADLALYASKHAGRDRTTVAEGVPPEAQVDALLRRALVQRLGRPRSGSDSEADDALAPAPRRADN